MGKISKKKKKSVKKLKKEKVFFFGIGNFANLQFSNKEEK